MGIRGADHRKLEMVGHDVAESQVQRVEAVCGASFACLGVVLHVRLARAPAARSSVGVIDRLHHASLIPQLVLDAKGGGGVRIFILVSLDSRNVDGIETHLDIRIGAAHVHGSFVAPLRRSVVE